MVGTPGDDRLRATSEDDVILTRGGDDLVVGPRGVEHGDRICTGPGDDRVEFTRRAYAGDSMIRLGSGSDKARIDSRGVVVFGGADDDTIRYVGRNWGDAAPGPGEDTVITRDVLGYYTATCVDLRSADGSVHVDLARGRARGQGADWLRGVRCAFGSNHDDVIIGTSGHDRLDGGDGSDLMRAGPGDDEVVGDRGTLSTRVTSDGAGERHPDGPSRIHLGPGDDAGDGGGGGADRVHGGPGSDEVSGDTPHRHAHSPPAVASGLLQLVGHQAGRGSPLDRVLRHRPFAADRRTATRRSGATSPTAARVRRLPRVRNQPMKAPKKAPPTAAAKIPAGADRRRPRC